MQVEGLEADVHYPPVDWRKEADEPDPDDELLSETPSDVVMVLGFDPLELEVSEEEEEKRLDLAEQVLWGDTEWEGDLLSGPLLDHTSGDDEP